MQPDTEPDLFFRVTGKIGGLSDLIPRVCHDSGSCLWTLSITHLKMGKQTIFIYKWVKHEGRYCDFFTHFLNLKLLFHSEFFVCEYLLFKFTLVVACVYIPNYDIISFEMVGFTNNNIIA